MRVLFVVAVVCALIGAALTAYDANTVGLINNLETCVTRTDSDIQCMTQVKDGLQKISDTIQDVRDLKTALTKAVDGIKTLNVVVSVAKYAPGIGSVVTLLKNTITVIKTPLVTAKSRVTTIDTKIYPWKDRIDPRIDDLDKAITYEGLINGNCTSGESIVNTAKSCVDAMAAENAIRITGENGLESFGEVLNPSFSLLNNAFGNVGTACATVKRVTDIAINWPNLSASKAELNALTGALDPILDFFEKFQGILDQQLCIPNPLEAIRELEVVEEASEAIRAAAKAAERGKEVVAERSREAAVAAARAAENARESTARAAERAREKALSAAENGREAFKERTKEASRIFRGWGRKRRGTRSLTDAETQKLQELLKKSISDISISENRANTLITSEKRGDICFSVQQILDGLKAVFNALLAPAKKLIDALLSKLPSFRLPGLPDLDILNFNIDFDLPSLDFGFDFNLYAKFDYLKFNCVSGVLGICRAVGGNLAIDCGLSLESFQATFGKRELSEENDAVLLGLSSSEGKTYVSVPPNAPHDRKDDKNMTMEEAKEAIAHMSPEGKKLLSEKILAMNLTDTEDPPETTTVEPTTKPQPTTEPESDAAESLLRQIARMLADTKK